jgi:hypothetical protein
MSHSRGSTFPSPYGESCVHPSRDGTCVSISDFRTWAFRTRPPQVRTAIVSREGIAATAASPKASILAHHQLTTAEFPDRDFGTSADSPTQDWLIARGFSTELLGVIQPDSVDRTRLWSVPNGAARRTTSASSALLQPPFRGTAHSSPPRVSSRFLQLSTASMSLKTGTRCRRCNGSYFDSAHRPL